MQDFSCTFIVWKELDIRSEVIDVIFKLNEDIFFVKGYTNGAIYDLKLNQIYSINARACDILQKIISGLDLEDDIEKNYKNILKQKFNLNTNYKIVAISKDYFKKRELSLDLLWLEITQACNLKCVHCYEGEIHKHCVNGLDTAKWYDIVEQAKEIGVKNLVVIGGEPCLHKDINGIITKIVENNLHATIVTNATVMSTSLMDLIIENKEKISVKVSIYGPNASVHENVTKVKGSFDKLVKNVKYLTTNGVKVLSAVVAMKENQDYLEETKSFIKNLGMIYTRYDVIRNVFGGTQKLHIPTNKYVIKQCQYTKPLFSPSREKFYRNQYENSCWNGKLVITETGDVLPCVFDRNNIIGNICRNNLREIIESDEVKRCWFMPFDDIMVCKDCEYRFACKDCRPLAKSVDGSQNGKNPRCKYDPYTGIWNKEG